MDVEETSLIIQTLSQQLSKSEAEELLPAVETTVEDERTLGMEEHETKVIFVHPLKSKDSIQFILYLLVYLFRW